MAPMCKLLVCGVHVLDGTETHEDMFEENAHTEARDARCLHASELKQSISQLMTSEMRTPGWVKEARIPDSDEKTCLMTVYAAHIPSVFLSLDDRKRDNIKLSTMKKTTALSWGRAHVHPCCCLRFRKPATAPSLCTSIRAVARPQKPPHRLWR